MIIPVIMNLELFAVAATKERRAHDREKANLFLSMVGYPKLQAYVTCPCWQFRGGFPHSGGHGPDRFGNELKLQVLVFHRLGRAGYDRQLFAAAVDWFLDGHVNDR